MHHAARIHMLALCPKGRDRAIIVNLEIERTGGIVFKRLVGPCLPAGKLPGLDCFCGHSASLLFFRHDTAQSPFDKRAVGA